MEIYLLTGRWLTTEELAQLLGVDSSTVRRWRTSRPVQGATVRAALRASDHLQRA
jgi:DNA-binding transcriptional regulator YiaG